MNKVIDIIPVTPDYYALPNGDSIDLKAICCFIALGFFLDDETYYSNRKAYRAGHQYTLDDKNVITCEPWFQWQYKPRDISYNQAVDEYAHLLEKIIDEHVGNKKIILPISGGLDSRTLAVAVQGKQVYSYSYSFKSGVDENYYGAVIAKACDYDFDGYVIPNGYLWDIIEKAALINQCYADVTTPRQAAVMDKMTDKGEVFLLGHWGDVLFDDMGVPSTMPFDDQVVVVKKKILKRGGAEAAQALWGVWGLPETFDQYLHERIVILLSAIQIEDANARIRAFKSLYWAPRWTSSNLTLFRSVHDIHVPYYNNEMCKFICSIPEEYLAGRQMQIDYLKRKSPEVASVPWQKYHPCNLYTYKRYHSLANLPSRILRRVKNELNSLHGEKVVGSNWELQYLGSENDTKLKSWLFENQSLNALLPADAIRLFYGKFQASPDQYHHVISMFLTISLFSKLIKS